jgi:coenzyme F420-reducing hydrogenase beta subunit
MESTSGGIFFELARYIIKEGGICYGACYDGMEVKHSRADTIEKLKRFRRSKYVQSDTDGIFKEVKKDLDEGKKVLFSGTPCQCVALKNYIKCDLNNLYTVDFICCGVPSPMVYKSYIDFLQKKYCSKIVFIWFKNKRLGWNNLGTLVHFENGKEYFRTGNRDYYMTAYVKDGLDLRLSCYNCQYRTPSHQTDITLGDFWGVKNYKKIDDREGISAVIINSEKGKELFDRIKGAIECFDADINQIKAGNFTLYKSKDMNEKRSEFFAGLSKEGLKKQMIRYGSYKGIKKIIIDIKFFVKYCLLKRRA